MKSLDLLLQECGHPFEHVMVETDGPMVLLTLCWDNFLSAPGAIELGTIQSELRASVYLRAQNTHLIFVKTIKMF